MDFHHVPVLPAEVLKGLNLHGGTVIDGTLGGGGHSALILENDPAVRLIGIDKDDEALSAAGERLAAFGERVTLVRGDFADITAILQAQNCGGIAGALLDLGVSSRQLDSAERGFTYRMPDAPLDMRMDRRQSLTAADVLNGYAEDRIRSILWRYGEERFSGRIAREVVRRRTEKPLSYCGELIDIITSSIPAAARRTGGNPCKRTFQALRIEVNGELRILEQAVRDFIAALSKGGRLCIISFHSLEDRMVKTVMREAATGCICPPKTPVCICGNTPKVKLLGKAIEASAQEKEQNPRSASAKLRVCEKL